MSTEKTTKHRDTNRHPVIDITSLIQERGTIPFIGFSPEDAASYPDEVDVDIDNDHRFGENPPSLTEALEVLPRAEVGELRSVNQFAITDDTGTVQEIKTDDIRNVDGLDISSLEAHAGMSLEDLAASALTEGVGAEFPVNTHKEIIDPRRMALRTLFPNISCRYRYYIGSTRYEPGDIRDLMAKKQEVDVGTVFGWLSFRDFGGGVTITTIYPDDLSTNGVLEDLPDDFELDTDNNELVPTEADNDGEIADSSILQLDVEETNDGSFQLPDENSLTVFFGEKLSLGFQGTSKLKAHPVLFEPSTGVSIPFEDSRFQFDRRHDGEWTNTAHERDADRVAPSEWHNKIIDGLDTLTQSVSGDIIRSKAVTIDLKPLPYSLTDFYQYLGMPATYAESAAERVDRLHNNGKCEYSLWSLQVGLKLTILDEFQGDRASDRYHELEELAGQLLRHPITAMQAVNSAYLIEQEEDGEDDEDALDDDQQTLFESLDELAELPGVDVGSVEMSEAQQLQDDIDRTLSEFA